MKLLLFILLCIGLLASPSITSVGPELRQDMGITSLLETACSAWQMS